MTRSALGGVGDRTVCHPCPVQCSISAMSEVPLLDQPTLQQSLADGQAVPSISEPRLVLGAGVRTGVQPCSRRLVLPAAGGPVGLRAPAASPANGDGPQVSRVQRLDPSGPCVGDDGIPGPRRARQRPGVSDGALAGPSTRTGGTSQGTPPRD